MPGSAFQRDPNTGRWGLPTAPTAPVTPVGSTGTYSAALGTQSEDYDKIMAMYDKMMSDPSQKLNYTPIAPQVTNYTQSPEMTSAISNLSNLSQTGGYTPEGIADIRSRGISPIRSVYANAQRNLARQRTLQGGYSPNYAAASGKMARELSDVVGQKSTDLEAGIAQNVAQNKLSIAPTFAAATGAANAARTASDESNAGRAERAGEFNANMGFQTGNTNIDNMFRALAGKQGMYGTNPALISLFGNQVLQAQQMKNQKDQFRREVPYSLISTLLGS